MEMEKLKENAQKKLDMPKFLMESHIQQILLVPDTHFLVGQEKITLQFIECIKSKPATLLILSRVWQDLDGLNRDRAIKNFQYFR